MHEPKINDLNIPNTEIPKEEQQKPENRVNKAITCSDPTYLQTLINARTDVITTLNIEKELEQQIRLLSKKLEDKKHENEPILAEYVEMGKRRYTLEYIDYMISITEEIYIQEILTKEKEAILKYGYSYKSIEILVSNDTVLSQIIKNNVTNNQINPEPEVKKYKDSKFGKIFTKFIGGNGK